MTNIGELVDSASDREIDEFALNLMMIEMSYWGKVGPTTESHFRPSHFDDRGFLTPKGLAYTRELIKKSYVPRGLFQEYLKRKHSCRRELPHIES